MANDGYTAPRTAQQAPRNNAPPRNGAPSRGDSPAPATWAQEHIAGSFATAEEARAKLVAAASSCHIVGGSSSMVVPLGHEIVLTIVPIIMAETYPTGTPKAKDGQPPPEERRGIGKSTLMQVAAAAGVQWTASYRVPPMGDPLYVAWKAVGSYRDIAGVWRRIEGDRDSDFRDGSPQIAGKSNNEIGALRANILRSTATKAKLRAIREAFGIPAAMTLSELKKPFLVARLVMTGRTQDPADRAVFIHALVAQSSASAAMLYGAPTQAAPMALGSAPQMPMLAAPAGYNSAPMLGMPQQPQYGQQPYAQPMFIDPAGEGNFVDVEEGDMPAPPPPAPPPPAPAAPIDWASVKSAGDFEVPFGNDKGKKISQVRDLKWMRELLERDLANEEKAKFWPQSRARLKAIYDLMRSQGEVTPLDAAQPPVGAGGDGYEPPLADPGPGGYGDPDFAGPNG